MAYDEFYDIYENVFDEPLDWWDREIEPIGESVESATVGTWHKPNMRIIVNPDRHRKGDPYFKVFNDSKLIHGESKVARLSFLEPKRIYHRDEFKDWDISIKDIKNIKTILNSEAKRYKGNSVWMITKWLWNFEYFSLDDDELDAYVSGELDKQYKDHPSYVPSDTPIPETWK